MLRGTIDQNLPGDCVVIVTPSGETKRIEWAEIAYAGTADQDNPVGPSSVPNNSARVIDGPIPTNTLHGRAGRVLEPNVVGVTERSIHPLKIAGIVVGSFGAAIATVALVASTVDSSSERELKSLCGADRDCADDKPRKLTPDELARARTLSAELDSRTALLNVTLVGSGLAVVTGLVLFLAAPDPPNRDAIGRAHARMQDGSNWTLLASAPKSDRGGLTLVMRF